MISASEINIDEKKEGLIYSSAENETYKYLFENAPFGMAFLENYRFRYVNKAFCTIFGFEHNSMKQISLRNMKKRIYFKERDSVWQILRDAIQSKKDNVNISCRIVKSSREICYVDFTLQFRSFLKNLAVQITAVDITQKNDLEEQLIHSQKIRVMETLTAGVVHQISTPLAVISSRMQLLEGDLLHDNQFKYLVNVKKIIESSQNISSILTRLLIILRQSDKHKKITDINLLLNDIIRLITISAYKKNVKIENLVSSDLPRLPVFRNKLEQVFLSIIKNAFDAMPEGGYLRIQTKLIAQNIFEISFTDTGMGMLNTVREKVFEPFYTTKSSSNASGLGLFKSYCFVKEHNGDILINSKKGKGTIVTVRLPIIN